MPTGTVFVNENPTAQPLILADDFAATLAPGERLHVALDAFCGVDSYEIPHEGDALHLPEWALNGKWAKGNAVPAAGVLFAFAADNSEGSAQHQIWQYLSKLARPVSAGSVRTAAREHLRQHPEVYADFFTRSFGQGGTRNRRESDVAENPGALVDYSGTTARRSSSSKQGGGKAVEPPTRKPTEPRPNLEVSVLIAFRDMSLELQEDRNWMQLTPVHGSAPRWPLPPA